MHRRTLIAACSGIALAASALVAAAPIPESARGESYSQQELVRGVVFATGPVAADLGIASRNVRLSAEAQSNVDALERRVMEAMGENDAELLADAATALTSGDPYQVRECHHRDERRLAIGTWGC